MHQNVSVYFQLTKLREYISGTYKPYFGLFFVLWNWELVLYFKKYYQLKHWQLRYKWPSGKGNHTFAAPVHTSRTAFIAMMKASTSMLTTLWFTWQQQYT